MAYIICCGKELEFITDTTENGLNIYECENLFGGFDVMFKEDNYEEDEDEEE